MSDVYAELPSQSVLLKAGQMVLFLLLLFVRTGKQTGETRLRGDGGVLRDMTE